MGKCFLCLICTLFPLLLAAQSAFETKMAAMPRTQLPNGVTLAFDEPSTFTQKGTKIIIYALPNGNTTEQTFGKKLSKGDDWHFDIQHIGAQTSFVRNTDKNNNYIVVYLENSMKSWPLWRRLTTNSDSIINLTVHTIYKKYSNLKPKLVLSGHSGGGSFIFGFINAQHKTIPDYVERIGFLDATYGYESSLHQNKLKRWISRKKHALQVISYNDSVVVYNGKPLVSATGGTWYRSKLMANDLQGLTYNETDNWLTWVNKPFTHSFILLKNPEAKILHTVLVERNGFIHLLLNGTKLASKNYQFWSNRAYENYILE